MHMTKQQKLLGLSFVIVLLCGVAIAQRTDRDAYNAYLESEQAAEYRKGNVRGLYKTISTQCYEVIDEVRP